MRFNYICKDFRGVAESGPKGIPSEPERGAYGAKVGERNPKRLEKEN